MLERIRGLWSMVWPDPAKTSLGWWMVAIHVAIVLLVGGGICYSAIGMLHDLADEQGKARVQLAGAMAREELRRMGEDAVTAARVLAERPTLQRLLSEGRTDALPLSLRRSCETSGVEACALVSGTQVIAQSGPTLDWEGVITAGARHRAALLAMPGNNGGTPLGASGPPGDVRGSRGLLGRV